MANAVPRVYFAPTETVEDQARKIAIQSNIAEDGSLNPHVVVADC